MHTSGHRCQKHGCGSVLVLDGNQKNNRPVCAADEAGFIEYAGLPGKVRTDTPEQNSLFCSAHKPRQMSQDSTEPHGEQQHQGIVEMILNKKMTRNSIFYEVSIICTTISSCLGNKVSKVPLLK